jgi:hypothetical protein
VALPDSPFDTADALSGDDASTAEDPGFPVVTALVVAVGEILTICTLILPGTVFKLLGYLVGLLVTLPAIGVHRQLLRRRVAVVGVSSSATGEMIVRVATVLGMLLCAGNAVLLALAWSR